MTRVTSTDLRPEKRSQVRKAKSRFSSIAMTPREMVLLGLPFLALYLAGLVVPTIVIIGDSFTFPEFSVDAYVAVLSDKIVRAALFRTFLIAALVTGFTILIGYILALAAWKAPGRLGALILLLVSFPVLTSLVTRNYAWSILLGRVGPVNNFLIDVGIIREPVQFLGTQFAIVLGMVHLLVPFAVLPIFNTLWRIDPSVVRASHSLGASPWQTLRRVVIPLSVPGGVVAFVFVFVMSLGFFVTPALLGGPSNMMVANVIDMEANRFLNFSGAAAIAMLLLIATIVLLGLLASRIDVSKILKG